MRTAADRLAVLLCSPDAGAVDRVEATVVAVARDVDEVGAAAIAVLLDATDWTAAA